MTMKEKLKIHAEIERENARKLKEWKEGQGSMKRYSISICRMVNEHYSKTGFRYQYWGRTDDPGKYIKEHTGKFEHGFQIKDSQTGKIVYKE